MTDCNGRVGGGGRNSGGGEFLLSGPVAVIEEYLAASARRGSGMANELADGVVVGQWLTCPVGADRTEEAMLDGIPLGCAGWVVGHRDAQAGPVCDLLEPVLPSVCLRAVGAAGVGEDQKLTSVCVHTAPGGSPPLMDSIGCEGGRVVRRADDDKPVAARHVINAVGNGDPIGIARKVVDTDVDGRLAPRTPLVLEQADKLSLLGVHADDRLPAPRERVLEPIDFRELPIAVR